MRLLRMILCAALIAGSAIAVNAAPASATPAACQSLTAKYQALIAPASSINIVNAGLFVIGLGPLPVVVTGLNDITTELTADVNSGTLCLPSDTADFNNLATFSTQLFTILISKTGLLVGVVALPASLRQTYVALQSAIDAWLSAVGVTGTYVPSQRLQELINATPSL